MMPLKKTDLRAYWTWMGEDGVVRSIVKPGAEITLDDAIENSKIVNSFFNEKKYPLLVNTTEIKSMSREARKYLSVNDRSTHISAFAIIVGSPLSKIIVNFFFRFNKTGVPSRMFTNEEAALKWLSQYKNC